MIFLALLKFLEPEETSKTLTCDRWEVLERNFDKKRAKSFVGYRKTR